MLIKISEVLHNTESTEYESWLKLRRKLTIHQGIEKLFYVIKGARERSPIQTTSHEFYLNKKYQALRQCSNNFNTVYNE